MASQQSQSPSNGSAATPKVNLVQSRARLQSGVYGFQLERGAGGDDDDDCKTKRVHPILIEAAPLVAALWVFSAISTWSVAAADNTVVLVTRPPRLALAASQTARTMSGARTV